MLGGQVARIWRVGSVKHTRSSLQSLSHGKNVTLSPFPSVTSPCVKRPSACVSVSVTSGEQLISLARGRGARRATARARVLSSRPMRFPRTWLAYVCFPLWLTKRALLGWRREATRAGRTGGPWWNLVAPRLLVGGIPFPGDLDALALE